MVSQGASQCAYADCLSIYQDSCVLMMDPILRFIMAASSVVTYYTHDYIMMRIMTVSGLQLWRRGAGRFCSHWHVHVPAASLRLRLRPSSD